MSAALGGSSNPPRASPDPSVSVALYAFAGVRSTRHFDRLLKHRGLVQRGYSFQGTLSRTRPQDYPLSEHSYLQDVLPPVLGLAIRRQAPQFFVQARCALVSVPSSYFSATYLISQRGPWLVHRPACSRVGLCLWAVWVGSDCLRAWVCMRLFSSFVGV